MDIEQFRCITDYISQQNSVALPLWSIDGWPVGDSDVIQSDCFRGGSFRYWGQHMYIGQAPYQVLDAI